MRLDSGLYRPVQISSIKLDHHLLFGAAQPYRALSASAAVRAACSVCHHLTLACVNLGQLVLVLSL